MQNSECRIEWRILNYSERRVNLLLTMYVVGVIVGLWRTDGPLPTKLTMAVLWPIGPLAFLVTINGLLIAAVIAFSGPRRKST
jgi:hypothetical protein